MSLVFLITTTLIMIFKKEGDDSVNKIEITEEEECLESLNNYEDHLTIKSTYLLMWELLKITPFRKLTFILITMRIAFATENMFVLKLIEFGVPRETISLLGIPLIPLQVLLPLLVSRITNGPRPLSFLIKMLPARYFVIF
jgi:PAT family acetyl-CoA transporter-like MFS transporter 1